MRQIVYLCIVGFLFSTKMFGFLDHTLINKEKSVERNVKDFSTNELISFTNITNDTLSLIIQHLEKSDRNKNKGLYAISYEHLWDAMLLAKDINAIDKLVEIHRELGMLYSIYGQEGEAVLHKLKSLFYVKEEKVNIKNKYQKLLVAYYGLAVQYRKAKNYDSALVYLDSCSYIEKQQMLKGKENPYVYAEKGTIFLMKNNLLVAEPLLLKSKELLEKENKHYLVIVYSFLGDLYAKKGAKEIAMNYYHKSLKSISVYKSHTDLKTDVLKKIAILYEHKGESLKAYRYLKESTKIADSLFSMRSNNNGKLFNIKNKYKETIVKKDEEIKNQQDVLDKRKKVLYRLIFIIAVIFVSFVMVVFVYYHKIKVRKLESEKEKSTLRTIHTKEKLNAILETKSKELTVSALQLIEKDKNIDKLLDAIKTNAPHVYQKIQSETVRGNKGLWDSFNLRFTEVNTDFYKRLGVVHSNLTPTEQKHCALIKLKFDSKEMARLLNISLNSVHISRHRIRKKIGLERNQDLSNYIAGI